MKNLKERARKCRDKWADSMFDKRSNEQMIADFAAEVAKEEGAKLTDNEFLYSLLNEVSKWVKQENQFMPLEYVGMLKEWIETYWKEKEAK